MFGKLVVANLSRSADGRNLEALFAPHGTVRSAEVIADSAGSPRNTGIGRVEMSSAEEATAAIAALNGTLYCGSMLDVDWAVPRLHGNPADVAGGNRSSTAVTIESDAEAAKRLAVKMETLVMQAGNGRLKPETARSGSLLGTETPTLPSIPSAPDVNPVIQAAVEVVIAANGAADAAMSLASKAADSASAASKAAAQTGSRPAGEAMSTANRAAQQNAYDANKASDAAAIIADVAGEQARKAEVVASLLRGAHE